ncbi:type IV secretory system conjugative DNA transfer family protein (plasmid) [Planococcus maritimus]|uniref:VirD4-like conjugal transfer protein, CD1115 family n=1 Tax=Planococcus maritimus TaxID=192421 RepID=UPI00313879D0
MENESKRKRLLKKISLPLAVFLVVFVFTSLFFNFLTNSIFIAYQSYFVDGTFFEPAPINITSEWVTNFTVLFSNLIFLTISMAVSLFVSSFAVYKFKVNFGSLKSDQRGSSRFTTLKEIQKQYKAVPELKESYAGSGGVPVSRYKDKIFIDDSAVNNLIVGTTRSGKGETFIFPAIDIYSRAENQPSMILNDPKGELLSSSKDTLEGLGYHVEVLNLMNPMQSMSYNLLELVKNEFFAENYSQAQQYARSVAYMLYDDPSAKDKFWQNSSTDLCTALILGLCEQCRDEPEKITMYNVALMMGELATDVTYDDNGQEVSKLDEYFGRYEPNHPARMQYQTINFSGGQTRASILANTNGKLGIFTLDGTAKLTSQNSFDMTKFGFGRWLRGKSKPLTRLNFVFADGSKESVKTDSNGGFGLYHNHNLNINDDIKITAKDGETVVEIQKINKETGDVTFSSNNNFVKVDSIMQFEKPIALFMIVPDYDTTFNVIASLYVKQLYTTLARTASNARSGKCFREVVFILDEFGNMPSIDGMANILTVCLGRNIRFNLVIQAYSQLEKLYGDDWKTIDGNTNNTFYILTDDHTTAEMISKKIGDKTQVVKSRSGSTLSLGKSKTENVEARPLLNADELMRLKEGEMIVIRTIKRQDTDRKRIKQFPIFNTETTAMKYRWEYLSEYYDTSSSINDIDIECSHADLRLSSLRVDFSAVIPGLAGKIKEEIPEEKSEGKEEVSSNLASSFERKPPKPKEERLEMAKEEQERLIKKREVAESVDMNKKEKTTGSRLQEDNELQFQAPAANDIQTTDLEELPFNVPETKEIASEDSTEEELPFNVPETKAVNVLNENIFRQHIVSSSFEEIYKEDFKNLSVEEVRELLIANKDKYKEPYYKKLLAIVEEKLEKTMG